MVDRRNDVPVFSTVMTTLGISAPDESRTVPTMVPNVDWASAALQPSIRMRINRTVDPQNEGFRIVMDQSEDRPLPLSWSLAGWHVLHQSSGPLRAILSSMFIRPSL